MAHFLNHEMVNRRSFMRNSGLVLAGASIASVPQMAWAAANTDKKFIFILQRGAADGLAIVSPIGDPDYVRTRDILGGELSKTAFDGHVLDSFFTLHSAMPNAAKLFQSQHATFYHAIASAYRERSHFDAQNIIESGGATAYARKDGWMNRLLPLLPQRKAIAIAPSLPLILRGPSLASSFEQSRARSDDDLRNRISMLYEQDPALNILWEETLKTDAMVGEPDKDARGGEALGKAALGLMNGPDSANIIMLETNGWDTHSAQQNRLARELGQLDDCLGVLHQSGDWDNMLVMVATEFGRTAAFNGTGGTDHGTASTAMLFGGALAQNGGGIVKADWPGLNKNNLYEGRDLMPTMRFEDMVSAALSDHFALDNDKVKRALFPDFK